MRLPVLWMLLIAAGCDTTARSPTTTPTPSQSPSATSATADDTESQQTLMEARQGFRTKIVRSDGSAGAPDIPQGSLFELIHYKSPVGDLAAYVSTDPGDGKRHPAIVWITGVTTTQLVTCGPPVLAAMISLPVPFGRPGSS